MFVVEIEFYFKIFISRDGNLPENEVVGWNVVKCRLRFLLDRVLESPDSLCRLKFNRKDVTGIFADNPTIEADGGRHDDSS